ncbi:cupin domain-containing protein [Nodosilinea nodulosa]|uniref:cupin domain-containing protein n=1 Tax=Nodosilinea nodulosa TaxID=416001 RepID=UPI0002DF6B23|nr:cupin domain-containing protein [Nodosilinea nodulosa]
MNAPSQTQSSASQTTDQSPTPPTIDYWHVWTDGDGVSHQSRCQMTDFKLKSIAPQADPQWMGQMQQEGGTATFMVLPVGWVGTWHENPKPQWIVPLSGRWFVETMDGQRVEMGPGEISFGEDQNTQADAQGRQGHLSGTVGDEPARLMVIQFDQTPTIAQSCRFS